MFKIVEKNGKFEYECSCGSRKVVLKKCPEERTQYTFRNVHKEVEYFECKVCGKKQDNGKVAVYKGPQNFPTRQGPQAQWLCTCDNKSHYVNMGKSCKVCGKKTKYPFHINTWNACDDYEELRVLFGLKNR